VTGAAVSAVGEAWQEEGRRAASTLDAVGSVLVVGRDAEAAAWVGLGLARAQAERRRVAIADLVGEVPPIQSLVDPEADPHGISDSFLYGVSLNKIAHQADRSGNLFVLASGSEAVAVEEVFRSDRWRRLASGFREVGALLLLVAQADTPGLDALAASVDGTIVVGEAAGALADAAPPLAVIAPTRRRPARAPAETIGAPDAAAARAAARDLPATARGPVPSDERAPRAPVQPWLKWAVLAAAALAAATMLAFYLLPKRTAVHGDVPARPDSTRRASAPDSAARAPGDSGAAPAATPAAPGSLASLTVANAADSGSAMLYSVYVTGANTAEGASRVLDSDVAAALSVIALTAVLEDGAPTYRMIVGAYPTRPGADSLLGTLRRRGILGAASGIILRTPFALRVADSVPLADVPGRMRALKQKNVPVYPLSRGDGTVALYAGAFETPQQAAWLARALQAAGVTPTLVYRTGRSL